MLKISIYCSPPYIYQYYFSILRKRVFILGPSHHVPLSGCALTQTKTYETPLYDLIVDAESKYFRGEVMYRTRSLLGHNVILPENAF